MYQVVESTAEGKNVYGIEGCGVLVEDLSADRKAVEALAARCNRGGLDPCQLWEVAADFVQQQAMD